MSYTTAKDFALTVPHFQAPNVHDVCLVLVTVTSPVQSEADQGELTLVPPPKEPDQILQPLTQPKTIRYVRRYIYFHNPAILNKS